MTRASKQQESRQSAVGSRQPLETEHSALSTQHSVGRRGLIAGAAALAAGVFASRTREPASANTGDKLTLGSIATGAGNNSAEDPTAVVYDGSGALTGNNIFTVSDSFAGTANSAYPAAVGGYASNGKVQFGVYGDTQSTGKAGVVGASGATNGADGVQGYGSGAYSGVAGAGGANGGAGVIGFGGAQGTATAPGAGVIGVANGAANPGAGAQAGVYGSGGGFIGVYGTSTTGWGVNGTSTGGYGVRGISTNASGVFGGSTNSVGVTGQGGGNSPGVIGAVSGNADGVQGYGGGGFTGVVGTGGANGGAGVIGFAGPKGTATAPGAGVIGVAVGAPNPGAAAQAAIYGSGGAHTGVLGVSTAGLGGSFQGGLAPLLLVPASSGTGAPITGIHAAGELYVDHAGSLFYCTAAGSPGTWQQLNGGSSGGPFVALGGVSAATAPTELDLTGSTANTVAFKAANQSTGANGIGVLGTSTNGIGVYGASTNLTGVFGQTGGVGQFGVIGTTAAANSFGLAGIANQDGCAAFAGGTTNANAFAASFQGHVQVFGGAFDVAGMGNKHGITEHPDGSWRTFYSVESPECWVEDFGEGTLASGKAEIKLDADFAALVHAETYHVFVTPHIEQHLHVSQRTASGFVVEASAALAKAAGLAGPATGTFSWRVVAKPKTRAKVDRLAKASLAPKIDFAKIPAPPKKP